MIVLDTNVLSALMRPEDDVLAVHWFDSQPRLSIWTTAVTLLEIRSGILMLPKGRRRETLNERFDRIITDLLDQRILPFDVDAAEKSSEIYAVQQKTGRNIGVRDTQIAGIVMSRNATLATRNTRHFDDLDIPLVDPWSN